MGFRSQGLRVGVAGLGLRVWGRCADLKAEDFLSEGNGREVLSATQGRVRERFHALHQLRVGQRLPCTYGIAEGSGGRGPFRSEFRVSVSSKVSGSPAHVELLRG